jgi:hypothetical protein
MSTEEKIKKLESENNFNKYVIEVNTCEILQIQNRIRKIESEIHSNLQLINKLKNDKKI